MSTKPWENPDYTPPADVPRDWAAIGANGGKKTKANKDAGVPPKPKSDGTGKKGAKRGTSEAALARQAKLDEVTEETIDLKRKMFYDRFIYEYLHDFNASMAWIRAGGNVNRAINGGHESLRTNYVQTQLRLLQNQLSEDQIISRNEVLLGIKKEANHYGDDGSSAARVRAWGMLAKVLGMDQPKGPEDPNKNMPKGGVMEVPMIESMDQWGEAAAASQLQLKQEVRK